MFVLLVLDVLLQKVVLAERILVRVLIQPAKKKIDEKQW
jgi:hypothetical protein